MEAMSTKSTRLGSVNVSWPLKRLLFLFLCSNDQKELMQLSFLFTLFFRNLVFTAFQGSMNEVSSTINNLQTIIDKISHQLQTESKQEQRKWKFRVDNLNAEYISFQQSYQTMCQRRREIMQNVDNRRLFDGIIFYFFYFF